MIGPVTVLSTDTYSSTDCAIFINICSQVTPYVCTYSYLNVDSRSVWLLFYYRMFCGIINVLEITNTYVNKNVHVHVCI